MRVWQGKITHASRVWHLHFMPTRLCGISPPLDWRRRAFDFIFLDDFCTSPCQEFNALYQVIDSVRRDNVSSICGHRRNRIRQQRFTACAMCALGLASRRLPPESVLGWALICGNDRWRRQVHHRFAQCNPRWIEKFPRLFREPGVHFQYCVHHRRHHVLHIPNRMESPASVCTADNNVLFNRVIQTKSR